MGHALWESHDQTTHTGTSPTRLPPRWVPQLLRRLLLIREVGRVTLALTVSVAAGTHNGRHVIVGVPTQAGALARGPGTL